MIKLSLIIILLFICGVLKSETYKYENKQVNIDLSISDGQLGLINFNYDNKNNDVRGTLKISKDNVNLSLESKNFDYLLLKKFTPKSSKKKNKTINIDWVIDNLKISNNLILRKVIMKVVYKNHFEELSIYDADRTFEYYIYPNKDGPKKLYLYSNNAGEILSARNINKDIIGGDLFITGTYFTGKNYEAILKVKNFKIQESSKFQGLIKSTRILDILSMIQNSKNNFRYMEVPFKKNTNEISINDAFIFGGMVGFTFNGTTNTEKKITDIEGFYGPIYAFDKYVDKIPLLNKLLTNKKNESLLGTNFSISTSNGETKVSINPLTFITPGKTKRIFKIFDFLKKDENLNQE